MASRLKITQIRSGDWQQAEPARDPALAWPQADPRRGREGGPSESRGMVATVPHLVTVEEV